MNKQLPFALLVSSAFAVFITNVAIGAGYVWDCRANSATPVRECWEKGIAYTGLGHNGPIVASGLLGGFMAGRKTGYDKGYATFNPSLRDPRETGETS